MITVSPVWPESRRTPVVPVGITAGIRSRKIESNARVAVGAVMNIGVSHAPTVRVIIVVIVKNTITAITVSIVIGVIFTIGVIIILIIGVLLCVVAMVMYPA